jgi:hypothetical protein
MAYSALTDIQNEFKSVVFSASSTPTSTAVQGFIAEADQYIDSRIGLRYQVPVTGSKSLIILKSISIGLVAGRVKEIQRVKTASPQLNQDSRDGDPAKEAKERLGLIVEGLLLLPDATLVSAANGVSSGALSAGATARFKKDTETW